MLKKKKEKKSKENKIENEEKKEVEATKDEVAENETKEKDTKEKNKQELKENKKQERKVKRGKIKESFDMYKFIIKIVASVILIVFAILMFIFEDTAIISIMFITGGVAALSAIIRLLHATFKEKNKQIKITTLIVGFAHLILGAYLIIAGILYQSDADKLLKENVDGYSKLVDVIEIDKIKDVPSGYKFAWFNANYYPLFLAAILYIESISYFMITVLFKKNSGKFMFWLHIFFMTASVIVAALSEKFTISKIVVILAVIAIICALLVGGEAIGGYFHYKNGKKEETKKDVTESKEEKDENGNIDPVIIPNDIDDRDSSIVS